MIDRSVSPHQREEEAALDGALRPTRLADFPGQERLKQNLSILIEAAKAGPGVACGDASGIIASS